MLNYIYQALILFRKVFSHRSTWLIFCMVTLGFIGSREMQGVTSLCRFWGLGPNGYYKVVDSLRKGAEVTIQCQVTGMKVTGNGKTSTQWYRIGDSKYVTSVYMSASRSVPTCK